LKLPGTVRLQRKPTDHSGKILTAARSIALAAEHGIEVDPRA